MRFRYSVIALVAFFVLPNMISGQQQGETYIAAAPMTISLDGSFSDWSQLPFASMTRGPITTGQPITANFAAAADSNNLYVAVLVTDSSIIAGRHGQDYWNEDSVEIYLNTNQNRAMTRYTQAVAHLTIPAANIGVPLAQTIITGQNTAQIGAHALVVRTSAGYAVEFSIPLRNVFWNINTAAGSIIGFQIQVNSASSQNRDYKLSWSNDDQTADVSHTNPSVFGELTFARAGASPTVRPTTLIPRTPTLTRTPTPRTPTLTHTPTMRPPTLIPSPSAVPSGGFRVSGSTIYDPQGNVFVARGTNVNGYNWVWDRSTTGDAASMDNCWNFNLVRVNSFLFSGRIQWQQYSANNNLDAIVNAFTSRGIVVMFEAHDHIGSYYQGSDLDTLVTWFTDLANRYRNNPYVWFDIMNEPGGRGGIDSNQWINMHGRVIEAIRGTGANNIIVVEGAYGGQDSPGDSAILRFGQQLFNYNGHQYGNIVFSIHPYDLWNNSALGGFIDQVRAQNLALVIGEYGVQTDQDVLRAAQAIFSDAVPRGIGIIVWHWDGHDWNDLTANTTWGGGWEINNCANPTNLSWLGQQIWDVNH